MFFSTCGPPICGACSCGDESEPIVLSHNRGLSCNTFSEAAECLALDENHTLVSACGDLKAQSSAGRPKTIDSPSPTISGQDIVSLEDVREILWSSRVTVALDERSQWVLGVLRRMLSSPDSAPLVEADGPTLLMPHLILGSAQDATNLDLLREMQVTHVLNCAAKQVATGDDFYVEDDIVYEEFPAEDRPGYELFGHFGAMEEFVEEARSSGGRVLVHCYRGVNRSGALCIAYHMLHTPSSLLDSAFFCKQQRQRICTNPSFQLQLLELALALNWPLQHLSEHPN